VLANLVLLWNNTYYAINRLYLQYTGDAAAAFIRVAMIAALFSSFKPHIWYISAAGIAVLPLSAGWGLWNKNRFLPDLCINRKLFSFKKLKEILSSGIWRGIQAAGEMLLTGLDLLICNIFINPAAMGVLALSKTLPTMIQQLNWQIAASFGPKLTISYAKNEKDIIWNDLKRAFKISAIIGPIPLGGLIVFGREFFSLWVPNQDAAQLQILSILACFWMALISGIQPIGNVFAAVNKVKQQAISVIISGVLNTLIVMSALHFTDLGIYAIAGVSVVIGLARNVCYTIPASALYLGFKWYGFYIGVLYSAITTAIVTAIGFYVKLFITPTTWIAFLLSCAITGVLALAAGSLIILNKQERKIVFDIFGTLPQRFKGKIYGQD
jgi:O-antigen/teichoic acid export membrane protein